MPSPLPYHAKGQNQIKVSKHLSQGRSWKMHDWSKPVTEFLSSFASDRSGGVCLPHFQPIAHDEKTARALWENFSGGRVVPAEVKCPQVLMVCFLSPVQRGQRESLLLSQPQPMPLSRIHFPSG